MNIRVGTRNQTKINAVRECLKLYPSLFKKLEIEGVDVASDVSELPKSLEETIKGAINRAKAAFSNCDYSIGIEGGLMYVPFTKTGFMEVGACAIFDEKNVAIGLSNAFEWPIKVTEFITSNRGDASQDFKKLGLTEHDKLGAMDGGIIGFLTKGRLTREGQTKQSIISALIGLENPKLY